MRSVAVQPEALQEIDDAFNWYEEKEQGLGFRFLHDLELAFASISRLPEGFQAVRGGFRRAVIRKYPYAVFFEFDGDIVVVHSVFHCSRNPSALRTRLMRKKKTL